MNQCKKYPNLIQLQPDGTFEFNVCFFRRSKRFRHFFGISIDGADTLRQIYYYYTGQTNSPKLFAYFSRLCPAPPEHPVIIVFDNELADKNKPICKFLNSTIRDAAFKEKLCNSLCEQLVPNTNLFIATHQLIGDESIGEIEHLFDKQTLEHTIDGKTLSLNDKYDKHTEYGKDDFSKYILKNYKTIDFSQFSPILDKINALVIGEKTPLECK